MRADPTTVAGYILAGVLVIYVTVRGLWRPLLVSLLYPWDIAGGSAATGSGTSDIANVAANGPGTVSGSAAGAGTQAPPVNYLLPNPKRITTPGKLGLKLLGNGG